MADQVTGTVETSGGGTAAAVSPAHGGGVAHLEHNPGRPVSWIAVTIVIIGSIIGGVSLVPHPTWWLFWVGVAVFAVGILAIAAAGSVSKDWY